MPNAHHSMTNDRVIRIGQLVGLCKLTRQQARQALDDPTISIEATYEAMRKEIPVEFHHLLVNNA